MVVKTLGSPALPTSGERRTHVVVTTLVTTVRRNYLPGHEPKFPEEVDPVESVKGRTKIE